MNQADKGAMGVQRQEQEAIFMAQAFDQSTIVTKKSMDEDTTPTTTPTTTPKSNAPQVIAAMLEVRRTRERIKSDYREVADQFKSKIRLLDDTLAGLFECLDDAEGGQLSLFEVDFALSPEVEKLLNNA
jgi:hypothetical protein